MKFNQQPSQAMTNSLPTNYSNSNKNKNSRLNNKKTPIKKSAKEDEEALTEEKNPLYNINIEDTKIIFTLKKADSSDDQNCLSELLKRVQEDTKLDEVAIICESITKDLYKLSNANETNLITILNLKQIKRLAINSIDIGKNIFKQISKNLKHNDSIVAFELNTVNLGENVKYLAKAIGKNDHLKLLKLFNNNLSEEGLILLSFAIAKNTSLGGLQIEHEAISDSTASILINNIIKNKKIHTLLLKNNYISQSGVDVIIDAIKKTCILDNVKLTGNNLSPEQETTIDKLTKSNIKINQGIKEFKNIEKAIASMQTHFASAIELETSRAEFIPSDAMKYLPENFVKNTIKIAGEIAGVVVDSDSA